MSGTALNKRKHDAPFVDMALSELWKKFSCGRSICFAASWYTPFAAGKWIFCSGFGRVVHSGKTNGVLTLNVMCHARRREKD
jgi:hypothetical protein